MSAPLVVVSAGTYHLPFDRLSEWMQTWLDQNGGARVIMQHGPSVSVEGAENVAILPYPELLELCREADAVVLQGGAGGVMDMRALGIVPIVVPRVPGGGEVVDDHQLVFSLEMESLGIIRRALTFSELSRLLADALSRTADGESPAAVATPGADTVRDLMARPIRTAAWYEWIPRTWHSLKGILSDRRRP